jgi:hypothetical protein
MTHRAIDFGPRWNNVLDFIGRDDLRTPDGTPVKIHQNMHAWFVIQIGDKRMETPSNVEVSYILNQHEVGVTA